MRSQLPGDKLSLRAAFLHFFPLFEASVVGTRCGVLPALPSAGIKGLRASPGLVRLQLQISDTTIAALDSGIDCAARIFKTVEVVHCSIFVDMERPGYGNATVL
jgi:hypothetical protein